MQLKQVYVAKIRLDKRSTKIITSTGQSSEAQQILDAALLQKDKIFIFNIVFLSSSSFFVSQWFHLYEHERCLKYLYNTRYDNSQQL